MGLWLAVAGGFLIAFVACFVVEGFLRKFVKRDTVSLLMTGVLGVPVAGVVLCFVAICPDIFGWSASEGGLRVFLVLFFVILCAYYLCAIFLVFFRVHALMRKEGRKKIVLR